jgi:indole-3-glycerol phosphate synthase
MSILDTIIAYKREEIKEKQHKGLIPPEREVALKENFRQTLISDSGVSIISEIKKASPSKGVLCSNFHPVDIASDYKKGGARAISVLTDQKFFQGRLEFIPEIKNEVDLPILRKDFIIDHFQIDESSLWGADAVLLIVAALNGSMLSEFIQHIRENKMDSLVEVHNEKEMEKALTEGADLIGVNNRDLNDFKVSLETTFRIKKVLPSDIPLVSESGISTPEDIKRLLDAGIEAALIGEALIRAEHRFEYLSVLVKAGIKI